MRSRSIKLLILVASTCASALALAQPQTNSPYSRLGLGDINSPYFTAIEQMGGLGAAYHDYYQTNLVNPASLGFLRATSFEVGIAAEQIGWNDKGLDQVNTVRQGNLQYLSLAFPMRSPLEEVLERKTPTSFWTMGIALVPYSTVGYEIEATSEEPEIGEVSYLFRGEGGNYRVWWNNAWRYKSFSVGLGLGYQFGKIERRQEIVPADVPFSYQNSIENDFNINAFLWNLGVQYEHFLDASAETDLSALKKSPSLTIGAYGHSATSFNTRTDDLWLKVNLSTQRIDTVSVLNAARGEGRLPAEFGFGVMFRNRDILKIGADFAMATWSQYRNDARPGERLSDTWRLGAGAEWSPDPTSYNNFAKRLRYRIGAHVGTDPRSIGGSQLTMAGVSIGVGLPVVMRQDVSFVNVGFEIGRRGSTDVLQGTYGRVTLGFTMNDNTWFYKRKFN